jgi:hypothetical protein
MPGDEDPPDELADWSTDDELELDEERELEELGGAGIRLSFG